MLDQLTYIAGLQKSKLCKDWYYQETLTTQVGNVGITAVRSSALRSPSKRLQSGEHRVPSRRSSCIECTTINRLITPTYPSATSSLHLPHTLDSPPSTPFCSLGNACHHYPARDPKPFQSLSRRLRPFDLI